VLGLLALSAALALATAGAGGGFAAKQKLLAVRCPAGQVAEAGGDCAQIGGVEGPIESFAAAAERTAKQSAPFRARTRFLRDFSFANPIDLSIRFPAGSFTRLVGRARALRRVCFRAWTSPASSIPTPAIAPASSRGGRSS
jgi:hypothetical protein